MGTNNPLSTDENNEELDFKVETNEETFTVEANDSEFPIVENKSESVIEDSKSEFVIEENKEDFTIENNDASSSSVVDDNDGRDSTVDEETPHMQMKKFLTAVSAAVVSGQDGDENQQKELCEKLRVALEEISGTEVGTDPDKEQALLDDLRVYDEKTDRFVMLSELSNPPEFLTADSKPSFDLVSKLLLQGHKFFMPKWNDEGQMIMDDPIMIGGGFVDGNFYLQVEDKDSREKHAGLAEPPKKPSFFDRFVDLFKRIIGKRDAVCEVWDRYEPFRKADHVRMKIKKITPLTKAKSIQEDVAELTETLDTRELSEEEKDVQKEAVAKQVISEMKLAMASEHVLSTEGREALAKIHQNISNHMRKLCEEGIDQKVIGGGMSVDWKWGNLPNLRGTANGEVSAYALYGMAIAFGMLGARKGDEALNQTVYRSLVEGNYDAIGGRNGEYKDVIEEFEQVMRDADNNDVYGAADMDNTSNFAKESKALEIKRQRREWLQAGFARMEAEMLSQPDPASPWSMELGRMLECAEAISRDNAGTVYTRNRLGAVAYYMSPDALGLCIKQREVEKGIGFDSESQEYRDAEVAVNELREAAQDGDFEKFAPHDVEMQTRQKVEKSMQYEEEDDNLRNEMYNFSESFTYPCAGQQGAIMLYHSLADSQKEPIAYVNGADFLLVTAAYSLADEFNLNGEDIRQFVTGKNIQGNEELTEKFKTAVQERLNCKNKNENVSKLKCGFEKMEQELYQQKDMNSPWAVLLSNTLVGKSEIGAQSLVVMALFGLTNLRNKVLANGQEKANAILKNIQDISRKGWAKHNSPEAVLKSQAYQSESEIERDSVCKDFLVNHLKGEYADRFIAQVSRYNDPKERVSFLVNNGEKFMLLMKAVDSHIDKNLEAYTASEEAFLKAGRGGAIADFDKVLKISNKKSKPAPAKQTIQSEVSMGDKTKSML